MKAIKIITHPFTLIISFLLILISGKHLGGFYALYILLGLPYGALHSMLAVLAIVVLLINYIKFKGVKISPVKYLLNLIAVLILILSLYLFFYNDRQHYNIETFYQFVPQSILTVFGLIAVGFFIDNMVSAIQNLNRRNLHSKNAIS